MTHLDTEDPRQVTRAGAGEAADNQGAEAGGTVDNNHVLREHRCFSQFLHRCDLLRRRGAYAVLRHAVVGDAVRVDRSRQPGGVHPDECVRVRRGVDCDYFALERGGRHEVRTRGADEVALACAVREERRAAHAGHVAARIRGKARAREDFAEAGRAGAARWAGAGAHLVVVVSAPRVSEREHLLMDCE